jgi:hypothetical protein
MKAFLLVAPGLVLACSEAVDPVDDDAGGSGGIGGMGGSPTTTTTGGTGGAAGHAGGGGDMPGGPLVINEISADGTDYIELYNPGATAVSGDGLRVADDDGGMPKLDEAVDLSGVSVAPGSYFFILAGLDTMAMPGPQTMCAPGPSPCYQAAFGISQGSGDVIYVIDADDAVLASASYPADAATSPNTWSRLPDGRGSFAVGMGTPGAANQAP